MTYLGTLHDHTALTVLGHSSFSCRLYMNALSVSSWHLHTMTPILLKPQTDHGRDFKFDRDWFLLAFLISGGWNSRAFTESIATNMVLLLARFVIRTFTYKSNPVPICNAGNQMEIFLHNLKMNFFSRACNSTSRSLSVHRSISRSITKVIFWIVLGHSKLSFWVLVGNSGILSLSFQTF